MNYQSLSPNIGVKDVDKTVRFYTEMLGFNLITSVPGDGHLVWAMVGSGDVAFMFQEMGSITEEYPKLKAGSNPPALTFYVKMKGMSALYEKIKDTEYLVKDMHTTPYGALEFALVDINGYILTITEDQQ